jgi:hypothetical protein
MKLFYKKLKLIQTKHEFKFREVRKYQGLLRQRLTRMSVNAKEQIEILLSQLSKPTSGLNLDFEADTCGELLEAVRSQSIVKILDGDQTTWNKFITYVFERRYGWSEGLGKQFVLVLSIESFNFACDHKSDPSV